MHRSGMCSPAAYGICIVKFMTPAPVSTHRVLFCFRHQFGWLHFLSRGKTSLALSDEPVIRRGMRHL